MQFWYHNNKGLRKTTKVTVTTAVYDLKIEKGHLLIGMSKIANVITLTTKVKTKTKTLE